MNYFFCYRRTVVAGITPLDFDHTAILGNTLESIAWHKSGIFKQDCMAFTNNQDEKVLSVLHKRSIEKNVILFEKVDKHLITKIILPSYFLTTFHS